VPPRKIGGFRGKRGDGCAIVAQLAARHADFARLRFTLPHAGGVQMKFASFIFGSTLLILVRASAQVSVKVVLAQALQNGLTFDFCQPFHLGGFRAATCWQGG